MHHALEIEEILYNIFGHCYLFPADLAALARTCRTFTDPALDILWETVDVSQLARCLPGASYKSQASNLLDNECYAFHRSLTPSEWDILRSYARRIQQINSLHRLEWESLERLYNPPTPEPLFPSLRRLYFEYTHRAVGLLNMPFPSVTSLDVEVQTAHLFEDSIKSFAKTSPNLRRLFIFLDLPIGVNMKHMDTRFMCQWRNLQIVRCREFSLDAITLVHLSRMPALTELNFTVSSALLDHLPPADLPISFSNLYDLYLESECLDSISRLLSQIRLPTLTTLAANTERCPSRPHLTSFLASIQTSSMGHTVQQLFLRQNPWPGRTVVPEARSLLNYPFLQPCTVFTRLRELTIDLEWNVQFDDDDLLALASAWPNLETFRINPQWGWHTPRGVSPSVLARLLQTCPSLIRVALVLDTSITALPPPSSSQSPSVRSNTSTPDPFFELNVLDAFIAPASVPVVADVLVTLLPRRRVSLRAWDGRGMDRSLHGNACETRWDDVGERIKDAVLARCVDRSS